MSLGDPGSVDRERAMVASQPFWREFRDESERRWVEGWGAVMSETAVMEPMLTYPHVAGEVNPLLTAHMQMLSDRLRTNGLGMAGFPGRDEAFSYIAFFKDEEVDEAEVWGVIDGLVESVNRTIEVLTGGRNLIPLRIGGTSGMEPWIGGERRP